MIYILIATDAVLMWGIGHTRTAYAYELSQLLREGQDIFTGKYMYKK